MALKHFLSFLDLTPAEVDDLVTLARAVKATPARWSRSLEGQTLAMIFEKSSTRTRVSFEVGTRQLGGNALFLSSRDIQIGRGEPIPDTARVLARYVDGIMARTFAHQTVVDLAEYAGVPVINGLTDWLHPCQALADLVSIEERFGRRQGLTLAYIGDGNNMAHSLMLAAARSGMNFAIAAPEGYWMDQALVAKAEPLFAAAGCTLLQTTSAHEAAAGAHAVYTDVWASMGQEDEQAARVLAFTGYQVDDAVMAAAAPEAVFMHCLPAHRGEEVSAAVCDGPQSIIFDQAENRLHAQKAVMIRLMGRDAT